MSIFGITHCYENNLRNVSGDMTPWQIEHACAYLQRIYEYVHHYCVDADEAVFVDCAVNYLVGAHGFSVTTRPDACEPVYMVDLHWNWERFCVTTEEKTISAINRFSSRVNVRFIIKTALEATQHERSASLVEMLAGDIELHNLAEGVIPMYSIDRDGVICSE